MNHCPDDQPHWIEGLERKIIEFLEVAEMPLWARRLDEKLDAIIDLEGVIITLQEKLDSDVAALLTVQVAIADEIAALKAQPAAEAVDFTGLDNVVAALQGLAPATPVADPAPVADPVADTSVASA